MTRGTTWSNPDGLVVGFGPNVPERQAGAVMTQKGTDVKVAKLSVTYLSTFGSSGASIVIPAGSAVKNVYIKVTTTWAGGTSLSFGNAGDVAGYVLAASFANPTAPVTIQMDGAYAIATGTSATTAKEFDSGTTLYFTKVGTYTAGAADVYVEYV